MQILEQALNKINPIHKKQKDFIKILVSGLIGSAGKKTFRNIARYAEITEHTIARQMSKAFDFIGLNSELIKASMAENDEVIAAQDTSFVSKSGKFTFGMDWFFNGSSGKAEKGLELDVIVAIKIGDKKEGFALSAQQTPANPIPKAQRKKTEKTDRTRIDFALDHVKKVASSLLFLGIKYMAADAFYAKTKYVSGVVSFGFHVISKLRKDSKFLLPYAGAQKARGRKRKTDNRKVSGDDFKDKVILSVEKEQIELSSGIVHSVAFGRLIKVVRVKKNLGTKKECSALLFSTDTTLDAVKIFKFYVSRFQIEFVFRDAKGFTGLGDCQSRDAKRINYHFNASLLALNVAKLQDNEKQKNEQTNHAFSMTNWARQYNVRIVVNRIISMLGIDLTCIKSHDDYEKLLAFGNVTH
jgi:hypothetical protein